jgi:hypothetical protein
MISFMPVAAISSRVSRRLRSRKPLVYRPTAIRRRTRRNRRLLALLAPEEDVRREVRSSGFHRAIGLCG